MPMSPFSPARSVAYLRQTERARPRFRLLNLIYASFSVESTNPRSCELNLRGMPGRRITPQHDSLIRLHAEQVFARLLNARRDLLV